ncbi:radical SAM protein [Cystobacter fuscus]
MKKLSRLIERLGRTVRVSKPATALLGRQFQPAVDLIEIDITFACNLRCFNCDRSCTQAPSGERMNVEQVRRFVDESRAQGRRWKRIRILGGEPTLHPELQAILSVLLSWRDSESPDTLIELVTNGHGDRVRRVLEQLPEGVRIKDTRKQERFQPKFEPFNLAPRDEVWLRHADYSNACWIVRDCGIGLNANGYYPCAVAGGIDRVIGRDLGRKRLPLPGEDMTELLRESCSRCGHFLAGRFVAVEDRVPVVGERQSSSWREAYERYRKSPPRLTRY